MVWSVDRLGHSLPDLLASMQTLNGSKVELFIAQQSIDTTTDAGRLMFAMIGAFAEFERCMIRNRVKAGIDRVRAKGRFHGRKPVSAKMEAAIRAELATGKGMLKIARELGGGSGTVQRVKRGVVVGPAALAQAAKVVSGPS